MSRAAVAGVGHLERATPSTAADEQAQRERDHLGFVMNATRLWAHLPAAKEALFDLMEVVANRASLTYRQKGVLVTATASGLRDPYCSLAWGVRLAGEAGVQVATSIVDGRTDQLDPADRVLAEWAAHVVTDPTSTSPADVERLRQAGFDDAQIFALTVYIGLRVAFALVNDSLGAPPDPELLTKAPDELVRSIFGAPAAG